MSRSPKPVSEARVNLEASLGTLPDRYIAGVSRADWVGPAGGEQAESNYNQAMQKVLTEKRRSVNIKKAGNQKWQTGALEKGAPIIGSRMRDSLEKWETNFTPVYNAVLRDVALLKPRGLDPMMNIDTRVKPVVASWVKNKMKGR